MENIELVELDEKKMTRDPFFDYKSVAEGTPLIIDNGSYNCRVGWSRDEKPLLTFRNVVAKPRKDRRRERGDNSTIPIYQVANDIENLEAVRGQLKTQFERNVVTQFRTQEDIFDYTFQHLGITSEGNVPHPILLTESLGNPNICRQHMNELLFECYDVPSLCYGIDSMFSYHHNCNLKNDDALIISFGYHTVHILPVLNGQSQLGRVRRLNLGGYHINLYLFRLMQMKYPVHVNAITVTRMENLIQKYGACALDYQMSIQNWANIDFYEKNVRKIQLPYSVPMQSNPLTAEQKQERRQELIKRITEVNARRSREKLAEEKQNLKSLCQLRSQFNPDNLEYFKKLLKDKNIGSFEELNVIIKDTQDHIERLKKRCNPIPKDKQTPVKEVTKPSNLSPPPNVSIKDWTLKINNKRNEILNRKHLRKQRRQELSKRHTHAAQERMRIISQLARNEKANDDFGMNDNDWDIYKTISREDSESELENEQLMECEAILRRFDPTFEEPPSTFNLTAEHYQLHFGLEAIRCPEILFQPSMIGNPECGLFELIDFVLKLFAPAEQQRLCDNIFLTGSCTQFTGLKERLSKELLQIRPFQSTHKITMASLPDLDAWRGANDYSQTNDFHLNLTTKQDYYENGPEFFKVHKFSNKYFPTPVVIKE